MKKLCTDQKDAIQVIRGKNRRIRKIFKGGGSSGDLELYSLLVSSYSSFHHYSSPSTIPLIECLVLN